ncbi:MAG: DNA polymerase III subunit delta, partial [Cellvibrionales bacterium]|nr:DNA polymerase III subunit delta [Cellvibrionales bacterium]
EEQGTFVQIWPLDEQGFLQFIEKQCQAQELSVGPDVIHLIKDNTEGNLLAAKQEIEKMALMDLPSPIQVTDLEDAFADASRFTVFHLSEQALSGNLKQALKVLKQLQAEGIEPYLIVWQLTKDIRTLSALLDARQKGIPPAAIFKQQRILFNKQPFYEKAMQRIKPATINQLLLKARQIDQSIKGLSNENTDLLILQLITRFCHL